MKSSVVPQRRSRLGDRWKWRNMSTVNVGDTDLVQSNISSVSNKTRTAWRCLSLCCCLSPNQQLINLDLDHTITVTYCRYISVVLHDTTRGLFSPVHVSGRGLVWHNDLSLQSLRTDVVMWHGKIIVLMLPFVRLLYDVGRSLRRGKIIVLKRPFCRLL